MEDSFSLRVDRVFGNLSSSPSSFSSSKPFNSSLWSLTDAEIEKREWCRETRSPLDDENDVERGGAEVHPNFDGFSAKDSLIDGENFREGVYGKELENDIQELEDEDEEDVFERIGGGLRREDGDGEEQVDDELEIKNSIGLDPTLDNEEDEDEYDKVAVGSEEAGDRLYLLDVTNSGPYINTHHELPTTFKDFTRDPRANHLAAKLRLEEDAEAEKNMNDSLVYDEIDITAPPAAAHNNAISEDIKAISKRKDNEVNAKSEKRVRFQPECKEEKDLPMRNFSDREVAGCEESCVTQNSSAVPDYVRNPSKYLHYTFDDFDLDDASNKQAFMDFFNVIRGSKLSETNEPPADLSKPIIFNPKKKIEDAPASKEEIREIVMQDFAPMKSVPVNISAGDAEEDLACPMEEDEPQEVNRVNSGKKIARHYRLKMNAEHDESRQDKS